MDIKRREFIQFVVSGTAVTALGGSTVRAERLVPTGKSAGKIVKQIPSICEICFWRCGIIGNLNKEGELLSIEGNPKHPLSKGKLCARGNAGIELLRDRDRLKFPMKRVGKRGEGRFVRISWDEALDLMADKLKQIKEKYGAESVGYFPHGLSPKPFSKVMAGFGTPNKAEPGFAQCRGSRDVGYKLTFGTGAGSPEPCDFPHAKAVVLIGTHIGENIHTSQVNDFAQAIGRGVKLITVDPRFSVAASKSDHWLPIKPATDTALLLAWIQVLIEENIYQKEYVKEYCFGFTELRDHILDKTPEWAAEITGITADVIRETARIMAANAPAVVLHPGRHTAWYGNDTQRARAMAILTALLGAWGQLGGHYLETPITLKKRSLPKTEHRPRVDGVGSRHPLGSKHGGSTTGLVEATIKSGSYPIKAWIVYGQNVLQSIPRPEQTRQAMQELDFLAVIDVLPTEQVMYADLVLPESTYLERHDDLVSVKTRVPFISIRQPIVPPSYDTRPGWLIAKDLATRLDLKEFFPWKDMEEYQKELIQNLDLDYKTLSNIGIYCLPQGGKPYLKDLQKVKFKTPSGKIELYSNKLKNLGYSPLPDYEKIPEPPLGYFRLTFGRSPVHSFARTQNNRWLNAIQSENNLWLNSEVAIKLGLADGDFVELENQDKVRVGPVKLLVTPGIHPEMVYTQHGFGEKNPHQKRAYRKGFSDNALCSHFVTEELTGATGLRVNFVRLIKDGVPLMPKGATVMQPIQKTEPVNTTSQPTPKVEIEPAKQEEEEEEEGC